MSALSAKLGSRTFARAHPRRPATLVLSDLRPGESAQITGFAHSIEASHARRLFDLGFAPGATVTAVRRAPIRDPFVYRVAECEIALRNALASEIAVERI